MAWLQHRTHLLTPTKCCHALIGSHAKRAPFAVAKCAHSSNTQSLGCQNLLPFSSCPLQISNSNAWVHSNSSCSIVHSHMPYQLPQRMHAAIARATTISRPDQEIAHLDRATVLVTLAGVAVTVSVSVAVTVKRTLTVLVT